MDLPFIIFCIGLIGFITQSSQKYYLDLLKAQEEAETARAILEVRVEARTSEIKKFAEDLSEQITEKTKKLQGKIEELEKFNKLAVGRELKMIELKEEIRKLKEELERLKGRK